MRPSLAREAAREGDASDVMRGRVIVEGWIERTLGEARREKVS